MRTANASAARRGRPFWGLGVGAALGVLGPAVAHAHFVLQQPPAYSMQDGVGSPQKSAPCGQADPTVPFKPSGAVTTFRQGQSFTLTLKETVPHPGHYRVLLAADESSLPADPPVTPGATPCGSTPITANPTLPLIADGVFQHTAAFTAPQSVQITLPPNFTCTRCMLQVVQFMSNHVLNNPGGCFYHHCATVSILPPEDAGTGADAATELDAGAGPLDASVGQEPAPSPSGGCQVGTAATSAAAAAAAPAALLFAAGLLLRRRRR